jgi:peptide/nickel transport system ATP-binding protein
VSERLIELAAVTKLYHRPRATLFGPRPVVRALQDVDLHVDRHERLGIVGESGSGKSTIARLLVGLERPTSGRVSVVGHDLARAGRTERRSVQRAVQMVFQDPMGSLDPRLDVARIVAEPLVGLGVEGDHGARVTEVLEAVGLDAAAARRYPHEFSGGQRQRIAIARALAPRPQILVADEPVSALDVSVRNQVLNLLLDLTNSLDLTLVFISHDLSVVRHLCERVAVFRDGQLLEQGATDALYRDPRSDYTRELIAAIPSLSTAIASRRALAAVETTLHAHDVDPNELNTGQDRNGS